MNEIQICKYCGQPVEGASRPDVDICRSCYYGGAEFEERFAGTLERLHELNANAAIQHTGGGCFAIIIPVGSIDEPFDLEVIITGAFKDERDGSYFPDAMLPETNDDETRWALGLGGENTEEEIRWPLTTDELMVATAALLEKVGG